MSEATREKATKDLAMIEEVTAVILPEPADANAVITLEQADAPEGHPRFHALPDLGGLATLLAALHIGTTP